MIIRHYARKHPNLLRWKPSIGQSPYSKPVGLVLADLEVSEWSTEFEQLMRNRLIMGAYRYGLLNDPYKPDYDRLGSVEKRLKAYRETGNTENLADIANMCLLEYEEGRHPLKHFASIDDGEHTKIKGKNNGDL